MQDDKIKNHASWKNIIKFASWKILVFNIFENQSCPPPKPPITIWGCPRGFKFSIFRKQALVCQKLKIENWKRLQVIPEPSTSSVCPYLGSTIHWFSSMWDTNLPVFQPTYYDNMQNAISRTLDFDILFQITIWVILSMKQTNRVLIFMDK